MSADGRIPDRWDIEILHDHIANLLDKVREPWDEDPEWGHLWQSNDLDVIQRIATGEYWDPPGEGSAPKRKPVGWPRSVCQALSRVGKLAPELGKPWRWRPGKNQYGVRTLIVGQPVIDMLEWAQAVFSDALADADREDEYTDRDTFIYHQRLIGRTRKEIRASVKAVGTDRGWRPLKSDQAISQAISRYCARTGKTPPSHK